MKAFTLKQFTMTNGLRVVLMPRDTSETVTLLVLIGVGSRYETPRLWGLSHFLEHMFFKGTETRPDKMEIAIALDRVGAEFNAFTGEEYTGYYVKLAKEHLALGIDVVSDILLRSLFPAEEIKREQGVITEEIRMYTDSPMSHVRHLWQRALFGDHPLGRRIDGIEETVTAFTRKDFVQYSNTHYHARNAVVAVAGNFDTKKTRALLKTHFGELSPGKQTHPKPAPRRAPHDRFVHERRASLDQAHLIVGVPGLQYSDKRRWAAELLAVILGGGMSSRLFMSVREQYGLAYAIRTSSESYTDAGSFATQAGLRVDKAAFALQLIMTEYDRVMVEEVGNDELNKAKQIVRGRLVLDLEETNSLASYSAGQLLLERRIRTPSAVWKEIRAVTSSDIQKLAQDLLKPRRRAVALLSPHGATKSFTKLLK